MEASASSETSTHLRKPGVILISQINHLITVFVHSTNVLRSESYDICKCTVIRNLWFKYQTRRILYRISNLFSTSETGFIIRIPKHLHRLQYFFPAEFYQVCGIPSTVLPLHAHTRTRTPARTKRYVNCTSMSHERCTDTPIKYVTLLPFTWKKIYQSTKIRRKNLSDV